MAEIDRDIRITLTSHGTRSVAQLCNELGVSQPTISRSLKRVNALRIDTRYSLSAPIGDLGLDWMLYAIDETGEAREVGRLHSLVGGRWWLSECTWPSLTAGDFGDGLFPGLPWFLDDARPQGFLGRSFARRHGSQLGQGFDPTQWSNSSVAESLIRFGGDLPGAFVLGRTSLREALAPPSNTVIDGSQSTQFPLLAAAVLSGKVTGSSAGGEQPKFTATIAGKVTRHVIVKFSQPVETPDGQRWADLLAAECIAARILAKNGIAAPIANIVDSKNRRFLEVERFDRTERGRISVVSLRSVDAAFFGLLNTPWDEAASHLLAEGWLGQGDSERLASLARFGRLIHNTDMHYGNASLLLRANQPAELAPVYDMLPMGYRPGHEGSIPGVSAEALEALDRSPQTKEKVWASEFWDAVATSNTISSEFRTIARAHADTLAGRHIAATAPQQVGFDFMVGPQSPRSSL